MKIHLIRHAEAVDRSSEIEEDHRYLTPKGRSRFREVASTLKKSDMAPKLIVTSPLVRAVQTADILAEELDYEGELVLSSEVGPGFSPTRLRKLLDRYHEASEIAFVGHEPDLGGVTGRLLDIGHCSLTKGMAITVKISGDGSAQFVQMVTGGGKLVKSRDQAVSRLSKGEE
ncbi:histidine phosphatase family protein [Geomonas sp. RF6]|uniref:SixA phosphatase family protein n=1 Tax=Geomonas sp. RF6 TaxID=2897342 RepID=UPI001E49B0E3|nr:phosphoglycerate mutase family protein [Geomonas sp. RF6]UFS70517.1 histidine phosphatase family protein [Geomonas sp. RF6]